MIIVKESTVSFGDWINIVKEKVFKNVYFLDSKGGLSFRDYGKYSVFFNHSKFGKDTIAICPLNGAIDGRGFLINNSSRTIVKIEYNGANNGYVIILLTGDRIAIY
jgi:hypothetical protein